MARDELMVGHGSMVGLDVLSDFFQPNSDSMTSYQLALPGRKTSRGSIATGFACSILGCTGRVWSSLFCAALGEVTHFPCLKGISFHIL